MLDLVLTLRKTSRRGEVRLVCLTMMCLCHTTGPQPGQAMMEGCQTTDWLGIDGTGLAHKSTGCNKSKRYLRPPNDVRSWALRSGTCTPYLYSNACAERAQGWSAATGFALHRHGSLIDE